MNTGGNSRKIDSRRNIESAFLKLMQTREINQISVTEICKKTGLNRSTFYANYLDIYDLADQIAQELERDVRDLYDGKMHSYEEQIGDYFQKLLIHIKDNQLFYKTYFKLNMEKRFVFREADVPAGNEWFGGEHIEYHVRFFMAGFNAVVKMWLDGGCKELPEEMQRILESEYKRNLT